MTDRATKSEQADLLDQQPILRCKSCKAEIVWLTHETTGKPNCFDAEPSSAGNAVLLPEGKYRIGNLGDGLLVSHYATCPHAQSWRRK